MDNEDRDIALKALSRIVEEKDPNMIVLAITSKIYQHINYIEDYFSDAEIFEGIRVYFKKCCEKREFTEKWFILVQYYGKKYDSRIILNKAILTELLEGDTETKISIIKFLMKRSYYIDEIDPLLSLLKYPDSEIRVLILQLLEKIADQWNFTTSTVWEISEMLVDKEIEVRKQALETLCRISREYKTEPEGPYALRFILKIAKNKRSALREMRNISDVLTAKHMHI